MQAEEIIQQKEWSHLTEAEKELLQPLAADEQEFNLLKKMLLLAEEDAMAAPLVNPDVQDRLHQSLSGKRKVVFFKRWHYAAAAVVAISFAAWFIIESQKSTPGNPGPNAKTTVPPNKIEPDTTPAIVTNQPHLQEIKNKPALITPAPKDTATPVVVPPVYVQQPPSVDTIKREKPQLAVISTAVKSDSELMEFVTEVY